MSLFATNRRTKKKFRRHKRRSRDSNRTKESEKIGSGYFRNKPIL